MFEFTWDYCDTQTWQLIVNMQVNGTSDSLRKPISVLKELPGQREWSRPTHDVTEGSMMLAKDKSPEANLHTGSS